MEVGRPKLNFRGCTRLHARQRGKLEESSGERGAILWCKSYKQVSVGGGVGKAESRNELEIRARDLAFYPKGIGEPMKNFKQVTIADWHFK